MSEEERQYEDGASSSELSSSSDGEVNSSKLDKLYTTIACLTNALAKSKSKVKALQIELKSIREETMSSSTCKHQDVRSN